MSLEMGGRSDKYGNQYENRYLARLLLRLVNEKIGSVIVEPLGADSDSVEFISEHEGTKEYYQDSTAHPPPARTAHRSERRCSFR